jgi:hypothetical protein
VPAGNLITQGNELFGQRLEAAIIVHVSLDLGGLIRRHALGKFFPMEKALQHIIGTARASIPGRAGFEKLRAEAAAPEAVNGFHLLEHGLALLEQVIKIWFHGAIVSIQIQYANKNDRPDWFLALGYSAVTHPRD